jgi:uncharacterized membrane protein
MTSRELLSLVLRRWYLMLVGAVVSVAVLHGVVQRPGVYWTGFNVVVLAPTEAFYPNKLENPHYEMSPVAGVLVREWNGAHPPLLTASSDTSLYGEGRRSGVQVRMVNQGSQWRPLFPVPVIDIQVVGARPEVVAAEARRVRTEVEELLRRRQDAGLVPDTARMVTITSPPQPTVTYHAGSRVRSAGATGLLGAVGTTVAVYWLERLRAWRRRRVAAARPRAPRPLPVEALPS